MFTGIIEEMGNVRNVTRGTDNDLAVEIEGSIIFNDLKLGDSVAVNGVCLTVSSMTNKVFTADIMNETVRHTSLQNIQSGTSVNLERAMSANGRFGGHIVSGHIDGIGTISNIVRDANAIIYTITTLSAITKYIVHKGSIAIDGISLTVINVDEMSFSVSVIPHTAKETTLSQKIVGDIVNLENDVMAKYVEKLVNRKNENQKTKSPETNITLDFLSKAGY